MYLSTHSRDSKLLCTILFSILLIVAWAVTPAQADHCKGKHKNDHGCGGGEDPPPVNPAIAYVINTLSLAKWGDMMVMNADGSNQTVAVPGGSTRPGLPNWSPDGRSLVYQHLFNGECRGLHVVSVDSNGNWGLPNSIGCVGGFRPKWKPDDGSGVNTIIFEGSQEDVHGIYKVEFLWGQGGSIEVLAPGPELVYSSGDPSVDAAGGDWSHNGDRIAFVTTDFSFSPLNQDVKVLDLNTNAVQSLIPSSSPLSGFGFSYSVSWARGQDLLVVQANPPSAKSDLWCINTTDPSQPVNLTNVFDQQLGEANDQMPSWSPDDTEIVFSRNGVIMAMTIDTSNGCPSSATHVATSTLRVLANGGKSKNLTDPDWSRAQRQ